MKNQSKFLLVLALISVIFSCKKGVNSTSNKGEIITKSFEVGAWISINKENSIEVYKTQFLKLKNSGIDELFVNTNADPVLLSKIVPLAEAAGLKTHAWMFTLNRPGDPIALQHPEWYAVSRNGESCYDTRPYVDYYQWLCPNREESRNHVLSLVSKLADVPGISSVHLDYIRFPDIFLPIGLLPKYNLVQDEELPEFDYCYCEVCISQFEEMHHKNPSAIKNIDLDIEWRQFRLNSVSNVVRDAYSIVTNKGKLLTAAVFPYPQMASYMVRQSWDKWEIDTVHPMLYHNFYEEELDWIGFATGQGIRDLKGKNTSLKPGVFVPSISPNEIASVFEMAINNDARGITFFDANALTDAHLDAIKKACLSLKK